MELIKIREYRKAAKVTQDDLAEKLGVNRATVSKYETGAISPTLEQAQRIADILGVTLAELLGMEQMGNTPQDNAFWQQLINSLPSTNAAVSVDELTKVQLWNLLSDHFDMLNIEGMKTAVARLEELAQIPKYKK